MRVSVRNRSHVDNEVIAVRETTVTLEVVVGSRAAATLKVLVGARGFEPPTSRSQITGSAKA